MRLAQIMPCPPLVRLHTAFTRFLRDRRGVAAIEFALIVPILLCMYLMTMEFSLGIETNKKLGRSGSMVGDLITQQPSISVGEIKAIMQIGESLLQPYNRSLLTITATAISISNDKAPKATVLWSRKLTGDDNFGPGAKEGDPVTVPEKLLVAGSFLIRVDAELDYKSVLFYDPDSKAKMGLGSALNVIPMHETYYNRPRQGSTISCTGC